jgi:hypothetical protein
LNTNQCPVLPEPFTILNGVSENLWEVNQRFLVTLRAVKKTTAGKTNPFLDPASKAVCCCDSSTIKKFPDNTLNTLHPQNLTIDACLCVVERLLLTLWEG